MGRLVSVIYTRKARKDLQKIDRTISKRIVETIKRYTEEDPLKNAKQLKEPFEGLYRYRIGDYRAIFGYNDSGKIIIITIITIKHRRKVYKN
ncbi:MAG: type II toxin-antitoxin system mRNA interferase toxin, RelE/StbE family [Candidatus Colwellbacteria bacterium CG10_big_fil_rev_8_21_14_0_10_41_28]|uniref:Type II toxin-antitoxin system mRNA interferase toxin, RelE/StbE family n=1 Tax=Candidatus Colwellbacteria bacterium CG10_big_fil_rev_8_21_14_0_10_41_28 TaxID=1974539 RepID=A0A2H0VHJ2_9BACT|nr:MAG: type II toxin-antitoxin system mRNA interferase toxin, RelE/StbE family [Candidatus Colwellbacteria bacterium CG10_big_fil_rev_8_21_14_0_10_41_28]